jgi:hypothetical protein
MARRPPIGTRVHVALVVLMATSVLAGSALRAAADSPPATTTVPTPPSVPAPTTTTTSSSTTTTANVVVTTTVTTVATTTTVVVPPVSVLPAGTTTTTAAPTSVPTVGPAAATTTTTVPTTTPLPTTTTPTTTALPTTTTPTTTTLPTTATPTTSPPTTAPAPAPVPPVAPKPATVALAAAPASSPLPPAAPPLVAALAPGLPPSPSTTLAPPAAPAATATTVPPPSLTPDEAAAVLDWLSRSAGTTTTADLLDALAPLAAAGLDSTAAALIGMGHFPVAGPAVYSDDWHAPRYTPTFHLHQGTDIFAAFNTPVRAPFDGRLTYASEDLGGNAAYVRTGDGTIYYMAHLEAFGPTPSGSDVHQGDIVGYVGDTGDARGGAPHVHFQVHPGGGAPINPKPLLDAWLAEAMAAVPALIAAHQPATAAAAVPVDEQASHRQSFEDAQATTEGLVRRVNQRGDEVLSVADALLAPLTPWQLLRDASGPGGRSCATCRQIQFLPTG